MEWEGRAESENVEDRRGLGGRTGIAVGGGAGVLLVLLGLFFGFDPRQLADMVGQGGGQNPPGTNTQQASPEEEKLAHFSKVIFHDTETVWDEQFKQLGQRYEKPILVLFSGRVDSACGKASAAVGPFYCPGDSRVYIDLAFYRDMQRKLNAPGEFARAYVIAHEIGHHVQKLLGYSRRADTLRRERGEDKHVSVRLELQADYLAGVWAYYGQKKFKFLQPGDLESALNAAYEIGDDRLQNKAQGYVVPDNFTHGTSQQRMRWFKKGFSTGNVEKASDLFDMNYEQL